MNKAILIGRLTKDPDLKQTPNGTTVCRFDIAVSRNFKNADGEYDSDFFPVITWRQQAEFVARYFHKGDPIVVEGSLQTRSYTATNGDKRYVTEIMAQSVEFVPKTAGSESGVAKRKTMDELQEITDDELPF